MAPRKNTRTSKNSVLMDSESESESGSPSPPPAQKPSPKEASANEAMETPQADKKTPSKRGSSALKDMFSKKNKRINKGSARRNIGLDFAAVDDNDIVNKEGSIKIYIVKPKEDVEGDDAIGGIAIQPGGFGNKVLASPVYDRNKSLQAGRIVYDEGITPHGCLLAPYNGPPMENAKGHPIKLITIPFPTTVETLDNTKALVLDTLKKSLLPKLNSYATSGKPQYSLRPEQLPVITDETDIEWKVVETWSEILNDNDIEWFLKQNFTTQKVCPKHKAYKQERARLAVIKNNENLPAGQKAKVPYKNPEFDELSDEDLEYATEDEGAPLSMRELFNNDEGKSVIYSMWKKGKVPVKIIQTHRITIKNLCEEDRPKTTE